MYLSIYQQARLCYFRGSLIKKQDEQLCARAAGKYMEQRVYAT